MHMIEHVSLHEQITLQMFYILKRTVRRLLAHVHVSRHNLHDIFKKNTVRNQQNNECD